MAYIERAYLTEQFESRLQDDNVMCPVMKVLDALEIIDTAPSADVEKIPCRCENCKFVHFNIESYTYHCKRRGCFSEEVKPTDFCSYGERRADDDV